MSDPHDNLHRELGAARTTIDVLKAKVEALYNGAESLIGRQLAAARTREAAVRQRKAVAEARAAEAERNATNLEAEVAKRAAAAKNILNHVTFGFLCIGPDLRVKNGYSVACEALLGTGNVEGGLLPELLGLTGSRLAEFSLGIEQVFDDVLPDFVTLQQVQSTFVLPGAGGTRLLRAEGRVIREGGAIGELLFTISDVTALAHAEAEAQRNRALVTILRQRDIFQLFLRETDAQLRAATLSADVDADDKFRRRVLHTLKGNAAAYGLSDLVTKIHRAEDAGIVTMESLTEIGRELATFVAENREILGIDAQSATRESWSVTAGQFDELAKVVNGGEVEIGSALQRWIERAQERSVEQMVGPLREFTEALAERLDKRVHFVLMGANETVPARLAPVFQALPLLVRNALDHGIEEPGCRGSKPPIGSVSVSVTRPTATTLELVVADDGRGIDVEALRARARDRGEEGRGSDPFVSGVSSVDLPDAGAGRGIGVSAMRAAVEGCGGVFRVESHANEGARFIMRFEESGCP
jgi:HPt (histidine-containing phosphotransfer) domain-containing protein